MVGWFQKYHVRRGSIFLVAMTSVVFTLQLLLCYASPNSEELPRLLSHSTGLYLPLFLDGCLWQPFTYAFLHNDFTHFISNILLLYFLTINFEKRHGTGALLRFYTLCAVIPGLLILGTSIIDHHSYITTMGASIPIFGLAYAFVSDNSHQKFCRISIRIIFLVFICIELVCLIFDLESNVSHLGHLLGFVTGFLFYGLQRFHSKNIMTARRSC